MRTRTESIILIQLAYSILTLLALQ